MKRFDTHVHLWRRRDGNDVRIRERVPALDEDFDFPRLLPELEPAGVERLVLVSAAQNEREPEALLEVARSHSDRVAGVVGWLDLGAADFADNLARLAADPLWLGLRLPIVLDDVRAFTLLPGIDSALDRLAAVGAVVQVLVSPEQVAAVSAVLERHPDLRVVIDHAANPDVSAAPTELWCSGIVRFSKLPLAVCKISVFWLPNEPVPLEEACRPFVSEVIQAFGSRRIIAAGNWPVSALGFSYAGIFDRIERLSGLSGTELEAFMYGNASQIYRATLPTTGDK